MTKCKSEYCPYCNPEMARIEREEADLALEQIERAYEADIKREKMVARRLRRVLRKLGLVRIMLADTLALVQRFREEYPTGPLPFRVMVAYYVTCPEESWAMYGEPNTPIPADFHMRSFRM